MALDGLFRCARAPHAARDPNSIDHKVWDPTMPAQSFSATKIDMRAPNKNARPTAEVGLRPGADRPLFAVVYRLSHQKGLDARRKCSRLWRPKATLADAWDPANGRWRQVRRRRCGARGRPRSPASSATTKSSPIYTRRRGFHPRAFALRALRADAALRVASAMPIVSRVGGLADTVIDANGGHVPRAWRLVSSFPRIRSRPWFTRSTGPWRLSRPGDAPRYLPAHGMRARTRVCAGRRSAMPRSIAPSPGLPNERSEGGPWRRGLSARASRRRSSCRTPRAPCSVFTTARVPRRDGPRRGRRLSRPRARICRVMAFASKALIRRGRRFDASKPLADPYAWRFHRPFRLHLDVRLWPGQRPRLGRRRGRRAASGRAGRKRIAPEQLRRLRAQPARLLAPQSRGTRKRAEPSPDWPTPPRSRIWPRSGSPRSRSCRPIPSSTSGTCRPSRNAWGYNSVVFGSPDPRLGRLGRRCARRPTRCTPRGHAILDVVFNHNGESDQFGPTLSFRGLDAAWFRLDPEDR